MNDLIINKYNNMKAQQFRRDLNTGTSYWIINVSGMTNKALSADEYDKLNEVVDDYLSKLK